MRRFNGFGLLLALLVSGFAAEGGNAQSYPARPIRIITASPGSGSDTVARIVAAELTTAFGQSVVVENRPSGPIIAVIAAAAAPDGYTLMSNASTLWTAPLFVDVSYDVIRDFLPIVTLARSVNLLVVHPSLPVKTVAELIKLAKARPGQLNIATSAIGGSQSISVELFKSMSKANMVGISYKDQYPATADLLSGRIQVGFGPIGTWAAHIKSGKLHVLASTGSKRSVQYPDLPTVAETLPGYVAEGLNGLFAPAKTPDATIRRLHQEALRFLEKPEVRERLLNVGQEPVGGPPEQLMDTIKLEMARVSKLIKDAGIPTEKK